jgi:hypothetical protein
MCRHSSIVICQKKFLSGFLFIRLQVDDGEDEYYDDDHPSIHMIQMIHNVIVESGDI